MIFDYYASLAESKACPKRVNESALASGFGEGCVVWSCQDRPQDKKAPDPKNEARQCYMKRAADLKLKLPPDLHLEPDHAFLPDSTWFGIDVSFTLKSPWYSKDDRPFHVLDNPVRKDRVFGTPFMSAASWKGLLRWACRMQAGLREHLEKHDMKMDGWKDPSWIIHLFGNEKGEEEHFRAGTLVFYPTWFSRVGFEVINPHSRSRRAGTQPIYYEVVPAGTTGRLQLLYAPLPREIERDKVTPADFIDCFIDSIKALLETYGISAKRTAGWGTAKIDENKSKIWYCENGCMSKLIGGNEEIRLYEPPPEEFRKLMKENGQPLGILLDDKGGLLSKTQFKKIQTEKPCTSGQFEDFKRWYEKNGTEHQKRLQSDREDTQLPRIVEQTFTTLLDVIRKRSDARGRGDQ